mmetsp:Transcript_102769/g.177345  ORF Transcript_102769/g.177345 Transcript_102769/m.177345 type:complete len:83 (-) Transcript_102769:173-421(-)
MILSTRFQFLLFMSKAEQLWPKFVGWAQILLVGPKKKRMAPEVLSQVQVQVAKRRQVSAHSRFNYSGITRALATANLPVPTP